MDATSLVVTEKGKDVSYVLDASTKKEGDPAVGSTVTVMYKTGGHAARRDRREGGGREAGPFVVEAGQEVGYNAGGPRQASDTFVASYRAFGGTASHPGRGSRCTGLVGRGRPALSIRSKTLENYAIPQS